MQILFNNWDISVKQDRPIMQGDSLSIPILVEGSLPDEYDSWSLLLRAKGRQNVIPLGVIDGKPGVMLTGEMLPYGNIFYDLQLRGECGDKIKHSYMTRFQVYSSISGDGTWPEVPTEFSQSEARLRELNEHPPIPDEGGEYWSVWDSDLHEYVISEYPLPSASAVYDASVEELTIGGDGAVSPEEGAEIKKLNGYSFKDESARNAAAGKVDKAKQNVNGLDYGVVGDGVTDDAAAIQTLIDSIAVTASDRNSYGLNTLYLPNRTYKLNSSLLVRDNVHFICDGKLEYTGTGSAIIVDGRYNTLDIGMIKASNGTALELEAKRNTHETMWNTIRINKIRSCLRGIYIHDEPCTAEQAGTTGYHAVTTNHITVNSIDGGDNNKSGIPAWSNGQTYARGAKVRYNGVIYESDTDNNTYAPNVQGWEQTDCGIHVRCGDGNWLAEIHFAVGHVSNFETGVYVNGAGAIRFERIQLETLGTKVNGVYTSGEGWLLKNCSAVTARDMRLDESFGKWQFRFVGEVKLCDFTGEVIKYELVDISEATRLKHNRLRGADSMLSNSEGLDCLYLHTPNHVGAAPGVTGLGKIFGTYWGMPFSMIKTAWDSEIPIVMGYDGYFYMCFSCEANAAYFVGFKGSWSGRHDTQRIMVKLNNGVTTWAVESGSNNKLQTVGSMVTSLSASSDDTHYPTAKCVYDALENIAEELQNYVPKSGNQVPIGSGASATGSNAVAIGANAGSSGEFSTAVGYNAKAQNQYAIQLGNGTNADRGAMYVGFGSLGNYKLLDSSGLIPNDRLSAAYINGLIDAKLGVIENGSY